MKLYYQVAVIALVYLLNSVTVFGQTPGAGPECLLPRRTGQCNQMTVRYYYNSGAGECRKFLYTGCQGNLNNFMTKNECNARCVCSRRSNEGTGNRKLVRYFFDVKSQKCESFTYRGLGGNVNRFATKKYCENKCLKNTVRQNCDARPDQGRACAKNSTAQYYYDSNCNCCRYFQYKGCGGNSNRFPTYRNCINTCGIESPPEPNIERPNACYFQPLYGNCSGEHIRYYYNAAAEKCLRFVYSGCGSNKNNFDTLNLCNQRCVNDFNKSPNVTVNESQENNNDTGLATLLNKSGFKQNSKRVALIKLAKKAGLTGASGVDSLLKLAEKAGLVGAFGRNPVIIGAAIATENTKTTTTTTMPPTTEGPVIPAECLPAPDKGDCVFNLKRYYFDQELGMCRLFSWSGCGGNANQFYSESHCESTCIFN